MTGSTPSDPSAQPPPGERQQPPAEGPPAGGPPPPAGPPYAGPPSAPPYAGPPSAPPPGGEPPYAGPPSAAAPPPYGDPSYGDAGYGSAPSYSAAPQYGAPAEGPADPPRPLALAVRLMYVGAALSVLNILFTALQRDAIRTELARAGRLSPGAVDAAVTATIVLGTVVGLAATGLWIVNAIYNARGRAWARVLSTVLGGLAVVSTLATLSQPGGGLSRLLSILGLLIAAAVLVLIWRPESSRYYAARSGPRGG